jgi:hypothetical protein
MHRLGQLVAAVVVVSSFAVPATAMAAEQTQSLTSFAGRADAVCKTAQRRIKAVPQPSAASGLVAYFDKVLAIVVPQVHRIQALALPTTKTATARAVLQIQDQDLALIRSTRRALTPGADFTSVFQTFEKKSKPLSAREDRLWRKLGADVCASSS